jgi:hypothetical protein
MPFGMVQAADRRDQRPVLLERLHRLGEGVVAPGLRDLPGEDVHAVGDVDEDARRGLTAL